MFAIHLVYPSSVNFILINIHEIRFAVLLDGFLEKSPWGLPFQDGCEEKVDGLALLVEGAIIVFSSAFHFQIRFIHSPACPDAFLFLSKGCVQLQGVMNDPTIDGTVIAREAPFGHHLFHIPITEGIGQIPANALESHILLKVPSYEG